MPEIKNTFVKSKMNKDLDSRLLPNGEYRDAMNVSVSTSEGSDVGALENIRGNFELSNFGLTDLNLEVIGSFVDTAKNRIYFFITNFVDGSRNQLDNNTETSSTSSSTIGTFTRLGAKNYIAYCEIPYLEDSELNSNTIISGILVQGEFLNFSKTHPILGVNLVEDLLFFTDNRNQPRKINVETAIASPLTYYTVEDDISVAKFAPFKPISFLNDTVSPSVNTLKNEVDEWLPATFIAPGQVYTSGSSASDNSILFDNGNFGSPADSYASPVEHFGSNPSYDIRVYLLNDPNRNYAFVRTITTASNEDVVRLKKANGTNITDIVSDLGWETGAGSTFAFEIRNPHYNANFSGDKKFLENKFVKFSYRFKYDDNEYSLMAPFSQTAFVPKQYGYFIGLDNNKTKESSVVEFMENQITTAGLVIDMPYPISEIGTSPGKKLKIDQVQLLYKASDETSVKVIADVDIENITGIPSGSLTKIYGGSGFSNTTGKVTTGGSGSGLTVDITVDGSGSIVTAVVNNPGAGYVLGDVITIPVPSPDRPATFEITSLNSKWIYDYKSQKPIKVLDEKEISRVNDIIPIRAKSQEVVGNRVVYGNFLQNNETLDSLNYNIVTINKGASTKKEFLNHSLKQGRTYQVGIVLQDRYGRASNVIVNTNSSSNSLNSTFYAPYTNGGIDPLGWPGNSLQVSFSEEIPTKKTDKYSGVYDEKSNPLGWYTYKIVVKQQEQDYYNIYVPGCLSGNVVFEKLNLPLTYDNIAEVSHIALFNDNINKLPRNLKEVGPSDSIYSSSVVLYNRVKNSFRGASQNPTTTPDINDQNHSVSEVEVSTIKPFRDFGKWATMKNVNIKYIDAVADNAGNIEGPYYSGGDKWIYPGAEGNVDPLFLKNNKNPLVATLNVKKGVAFIDNNNNSTSSRLGYTSVSQESTNFDFAKKLMVFETKPFKSNLDIYYETSSTGLITDFNTSVAYPTGASGQPTDLTSFVGTWLENQNNVDVSNVFQCADSQGVPITQNTPKISILLVEQLDLNGNYQVCQSPFDLTTVQQPGFNQPETYKLTTNSPSVYLENSHMTGNYRITFRLSAIGRVNVDVQKTISLSNVVPSVKGVRANFRSNGGYANRPKYLVKIFTDAEFNDFYAENDQQWSASPLDSNNGPIDFETVATARVQYRKYLSVYNRPEGGKYTDNYLFTVSHSSNGSEVLGTPTGSNRNGLSTSQPRQEGLVYEIIRVNRYSCQFNKTDGRFKKIGVADGGEEKRKENEFVVDPSTGAIRFVINGEINKSDFSNASTDSGWCPAWAYFIFLKTHDASKTPQGSRSTLSRFFWIVTKDNVDIPDVMKYS